MLDESGFNDLELYVIAAARNSASPYAAAFGHQADAAKVVGREEITEGFITTVSTDVAAAISFSVYPSVPGSTSDWFSAHLEVDGLANGLMAIVLRDNLFHQIEVLTYGTEILDLDPASLRALSPQVT